MLWYKLRSKLKAKNSNDYCTIIRIPLQLKHHSSRKSFANGYNKVAKNIDQERVSTTLVLRHILHYYYKYSCSFFTFLLIIGAATSSQYN